jgi:acetyl-CoA carboxylase carboxyltransferase component
MTGARVDQGAVEVRSPFTGVVVEVVAGADTPVAAGAAVIVLESMKMHHEVAAPVAGMVREVRVSGGEQVASGDILFAVEPRQGEEPPAAAKAGAGDLDAPRPDLAAVLERRDAILDAARPAAVERRHGAGRRTARENVEDLCDPDTFSEYGGLALAAQRARRSEQELIEQTPGDGMVCGVGAINGEAFSSEDARCVVMSYDYTVLAGTQGVRNHKKTDRMLDVAERLRLPVVLFAEGGGGRPGDTDQSELFHLVVPTFQSFARLSGLVPRVGIVSGRCFAGNAALLGCCDVIVATPDASIGMGGPAMIEGGGLGSFSPEEVGPAAVQTANGVIDVLAPDEQAAVEVARRFLSYFQGELTEWDSTDQRALRTLVPEDPKRTHDPRRVLETLADSGSVLELRREWGRTIVTALARIEGRAIGVIASDPAHLSGAIDADGSDKAARFMQLCDAFGLPVLSLVDTPGFMVGPESEATAMVRRCSRMFVTAATLSVPWLCVTLRRAYGLGAQAMAGGGFHVPILNVAWPTGEFGAMGVEGAVRLALRRELEAIEDDEEREARVQELVAQVRANSGAVNMAAHFEIDDVIDPAETRGRLVEALAASPRPDVRASGRRRTMVDPW